MLYIDKVLEVIGKLMEKLKEALPKISGDAGGSLVIEGTLGIQVDLKVVFGKLYLA